jgi:hypothetical protein
MVCGILVRYHEHMKVYHRTKVILTDLEVWIRFRPNHAFNYGSLHLVYSTHHRMEVRVNMLRKMHL